LNFLFCGKGVLKSRTDVAAVDTGNHGGVGVLGELGKSLGKNRLRGGGERRDSLFHSLMESAAENGKDAKGAIWEKQIPQGLKPDDDEFDRVLSLESAGFLADRERAG
jgi:hypothetical protein